MSEGDRFIGMTVAEIMDTKSRPPAGPYAIGSDHIPGLSKLIEEIGEVGQVAGKVIGLGHMGDHWDGSNLKARMETELGDLLASISYFIEENGLDGVRVYAQRNAKVSLFYQWHAAHRPRVSA